MRWAFGDNGHAVELVEYMEMGGGVEEIVVWCHTCNPKGLRLPTFDMREYPKYRLAFEAARACAKRHTSKFPSTS